MYRKVTLKRAVSLILATFPIFLIVSCATVYHGYPMKGSVVDASNSGIVLCIGSEDGASVGQELDVYEVIEQASEPLAKPNFKRVQTGKVKITEIIDKHFAKATVISGKAEKDDIVELVRQK